MLAKNARETVNGTCLLLNFVDVLGPTLVRVCKLAFFPFQKGAAAPVLPHFTLEWNLKLVKSLILDTEFDSNRGSKCFGCLVSAKAHRNDSCQVLFGKALCGCGPRARAAAWQHQRG